MQQQQDNITKEDEGTRLDKYLAQHFIDFSRSSLQKRIKNGDILINSGVVSPHYKLKKEDSITIREHPVNSKKCLHIPTADVIAEEKDFIVIHKPVGLLVHPTEKSQEETLVDQILKKYPKIQSVGEDPSRPGIVHRLDRDVSGVMVVARTWEMYEHLKEQFKKRKVTKVYTALVHGQPEKMEGEITFRISRSKRHPGRMAAKPDSTGKTAATAYEVIETFPNYSLLKAFPKTGRMHQIRVHLRAYGLPIVGDQLYHGRSRNKDFGIIHPLLIATELTFIGLKDEPRSYKASLSADFKEVLKGLRGKKAS